MLPSPKVRYTFKLYSLLISLWFPFGGSGLAGSPALLRWTHTPSWGRLSPQRQRRRPGPSPSPAHQPFSSLKYILSIMLLQLPQMFPLCHPVASTALPSSNAPLSSCPWFVSVSSLASSFPILFLTSSCLFCAYQLCFLFPVSFPPILPPPPPCW